MKITIFTGAGISKESGINTFRDKGGIWDLYDPIKVSSKDGWKKDRESVLEFYNLCHEEMKDKIPNKAHKYLAKLEEKHDVTVITQNCDILHEMAGSTNVIHLHGNINETCSSLDRTLIYPYDKPIMIGDLCEKGSQLKPNIVLFGESPSNIIISKAIDALKDCEILIIIGTSLDITYTLDMLEMIDTYETSVFYIDPNPSNFMDSITHVEYIKEKATKGVPDFCKKIM